MTITVERELAAAGEGAIIVKTTSHRSRSRMRAYAPEAKPMFSFHREGNFYAIPAEHADSVLAIKGITRSRKVDDLLPCLTFRSNA